MKTYEQTLRLFERWCQEQLDIAVLHQEKSFGAIMSYHVCHSDSLLCKTKIMQTGYAVCSLCKRTYLHIVHTLAQQSGLDQTEEELERLAEQYALERGGRSARLARQVIDRLLTQQE